MNAKKYSLRNGINPGVADSDPHLIATFAWAFANLSGKNYGKKWQPQNSAAAMMVESKLRLIDLFIML